MNYEKNKYFVKKNKVFAVGDEVVCVDGGDLEGLRGVITAIKTGSDCVFPVHEYEIVVDMYSPSNPNIQKRLLDTPAFMTEGCVELADEYDFSKLLMGVVFNNVDELELYDPNIKMLQPYSCALETEAMKAYIVTIEHDLGENDTKIRNSVCYSDVNDAMKALSRAIAVVQETHKNWLESSDICITVGEDRFVATTVKNYLQVTLTVADVSVNPTQQRLLSNEYSLFHHTEDVRSSLYEKWKNNDITDEEYCCMYENARKLAKTFEEAYSDNGCRADCFWATIDAVIDRYNEEDM